MRPPRPVVCDGCGKTKGETNHWWTVTTTSLEICILSGSTDENAALLPKDFCGQKCMMAYVSKRVGELNL